MRYEARLQRCDKPNGLRLGIIYAPDSETARKYAGERWRKYKKAIIVERAPIHARVYPVEAFDASELRIISGRCGQSDAVIKIM